MLQKRAMRIVLKTSRQSHTRPMFYKLKALHFHDIVSVNIAAFTHKAFLQRITSKNSNKTIHKCGTRGVKNFIIKLYKTKKGISTSSLKDQDTGISSGY